MSIRERKSDKPRPQEERIALSLKLLLIGFFITLVGILISAASILLRTPLSGEMSGGAVIFIGPFPIVFGAGPHAPILILLGLFITLVMLLLIFFIILSHR